MTTPGGSPLQSWTALTKSPVPTQERPPPAPLPSGGAVSALPNLSLPPCWPTTQGHRGRHRPQRAWNPVSPTPLGGSGSAMTRSHLGLPSTVPCGQHAPIPPDASAPSVPGPPAPQHPCVRDQTPGPCNSLQIQAELKPRVGRFRPPGSAPSPQTNTTTSLEAKPSSDVWRRHLGRR